MILNIFKDTKLNVDFGIEVHWDICNKQKSKKVINTLLFSFREDLMNRTKECSEMDMSSFFLLIKHSDVEPWKNC